MKIFLFGCLVVVGLFLGCASAPKKMHSPSVMPAVANPKAKIVADLSFRIPAEKEKKFYYKFADGDTIIFNAWAIEGKDISELSITKWPATTVFNSWAVPVVKNKKIFVEKESVYSFIFKNTGLMSSKVYKFTLHRVPTEEKYLDFSTSVEWDTLYDTTYVAAIESTLVRVDTIPEEITNTQKKIGAREKSYIKVSLPEGTSYWVYWIGVGQEAAKGLQEMASQLPKAAGILGITDPVTAFAIGLLPKLFTLNKGYDINYYLIRDYDNVSKFIEGKRFYLFKEGGRTITDYTKMEKPTEGTFYIGLDNSYSILTSKIVTVKVVAVKIIPKYDVREVQKPEVKKRVVPKMHE